MFLSPFKFWFPVILAPILFSSCCHIDRVSTERSQLIVRLQNEMLAQWLTTADDATAVFPRWLLCLSSSDAKREAKETALAKYLSSPDAITRLRAGFVLGRLKNISPNSLAALRHQLHLEPADS